MWNIIYGTEQDCVMLTHVRIFVYILHTHHFTELYGCGAYLSHSLTLDCAESVCSSNQIAGF